jgi:hypothetical protein
MELVGWVVFLVLFASGVWVMLRFIFPAYMYVGVDRDTAPETGEIAVGEPVESITCAGVVGAVRFAGPLLRVRLFESGLSVKPAFMPLISLPLSCVTTIAPSQRVFMRGIEIVHDCGGVPRPIVLRIHESSSFALALAGLLGARPLAQQAHRADAAS